MESGAATSAAAMLNGFNIENNISDNLANLRTPGFKARSAIQVSFAQLLAATQGDQANPAAPGMSSLGPLGGAPQIQQYGLNLAQGTPRHTGAPLDLMVAGNGFFTVQAPSGIALTRNGSFHRSEAGFLATNEGYAVLDTAGKPMKVPQGTITVDHGGEVSVEGTRLGRLGLAQVPTGKPLTELGGGYYSGPGAPLSTRAGTVAVLQGYVEESNVDMATETSAMMAAQRAYQANSRMLQMQDDTMSLTVNDLGKVSG